MSETNDNVLPNQVTEILTQIKAGLQRQGFVGGPPVAGQPPEPAQPVTGTTQFQQQVETIRQDALQQTTDNPEKGKADMQFKRALAGGKRADIVEVSRRIARELASNGPVSIDDVTLKLRTEGYESSADVEPGNRRHWKGSVFTTSEWVSVGKLPSRIPANHARPVSLWCTKDWLRRNSLNGTNMSGSRFYTAGITSDFRRANPGVQLQDCNWRIGTGRLGTQIASEIDAGNMTLYGAPVILVPNAVGAILELPPDAPNIEPPTTEKTDNEPDPSQHSAGEQEQDAGQSGPAEAAPGTTHADPSSTD